MSRNLVWVACLVMTLALGAMPSKASARTDVSVDIRIGDPYRGPRIVFQREPDIVVVPGTRVYYVRDYDYDLYRYGGFWYYNYDGGWYRARRYNGPFVYIGYRSVPREIAYVPVRYRRHWRAYDSGPRRYYREERRDQGLHRGDDQGMHRGDDRGWQRGDEKVKDKGKGNKHGRGHGHD